MPPPNFPLFVSSLLIIILSIAVHTYSQDIPDNTPFVTYDCYGENFTSSTPYDSNVRLLLANLVASTPNSASFFSLINYTSPQIFGLAQCRPDLTPSVCAACLNQTAVATTNKQGCGLKKSFANRARNCLLRYSDQMFYNAPEETIFVYYPNAPNASASFNSQVNILMNSSVIASAAAAPLRFAVGVTNDSVDRLNIYGMGWCSMDLTSSDCSQCLDKVLGRLPPGKNWGDGAFVSCEVRFEKFQFYSNSIITPAMEAGGDSGKKRTTRWRLIIFLPLGMFLIISTIVCLIWLKKRSVKETSNSENDQTPIILGTEWASKLEIRDSSLEFSLISFSSIVEATGNFSAANKLGQGGFGSVYKGQLPEGKSIAVKRLDTCSGQGLQEFMNEIRLIAKLQHQNLVKLLGCCVEGDEKLLVYEYMPNNSLDYHLFDPVRKELLDWSKRFAIIEGITQGLLYLHKYSRVRIIHRDLKASNILLDLDMNPKISDFGMARIFDANTAQANTNRIVGTYGYMSPEYAMEGIFSIKSDVFSFGVMMLEIISGKRNTTFHKSGKALNLLTHAWELWKSGNLLDFVDPSLGEKIFINEVLKYIIVALVCVQENAIDRPTMPKVIAMLGSDNTTLPDPKKPAFFTAENEEASKLSINELATQNDSSFSVLEGR